MLPYLNFSLEQDEGEAAKTRRTQVKKHDWQSYIRLEPRGFQARVIPAENTLKLICEDLAKQTRKHISNILSGFAGVIRVY